MELFINCPLPLPSRFFVHSCCSKYPGISNDEKSTCEREKKYSLVKDEESKRSFTIHGNVEWRI